MSGANLFDEIDIIEHVRQNRTKNNSSSHFEGGMSDSFFEWYFSFFLENAAQFGSEIVDIMSMLTGFVPEIHSIVGE